jgi:GT2 family glycosyltransferase
VDDAEDELALGDAADQLTLSVVICAFSTQRWPRLQAAVASVAAQSVAAEVVVVIDHNDELLTLATNTFVDATVVPNHEPRGVSGARNSGVWHSVGSVVVFLDDDAAAAPGWLARFRDHYADPAVMGVGGAVLPDWDGPEPTWLPAEFWWVLGCTYVGLPTQIAPVRNFVGANMSYRRSVLDKVGGFVDSLGRIGNRTVGCEETELGIRARRAFPESRFIHDPAALVHHAVGRERLTWGYFWHRCWAEGRSKAVVSAIAGADDALESERRYIRRVLPRAVVAGLRIGPVRGGWQRAGAVIAGLAITSAGYGYGLMRSAAIRST